MSTPLTSMPGRPSPSEAPGRAALIAVPAGWTVLVALWALTGATLSPSRLLGTALLIALPTVLWWSAPRQLRTGLVASASLLLLAGMLLGDTSEATIGAAVGGPTAWAAVALAVSSADARDARDARRRYLGKLVGAAGLLLLLAPSTGPTGPRVAGATVTVLLGVRVGRALSGTGVPSAGRPAAPARTSLAVGGSIGLLALAVARTVVDLDAPVLTVVRALRRFASLILPTSAGLEVSLGIGGSPLPWLLPLVGGGVTLLLTVRQHGPAATALASRAPRAAQDRAAQDKGSAPLPNPAAALIVAGLTASALLHLVGVHWAGALDVSYPEWLLWPDRRIETVLWGALAVASGRGWRLREHPEAAAVAGVIGLVLLTVLIGEWRVDGVALRPDLLAVPAVFLGIIGLGRSGARPVVTGIAFAGLPVLLLGMGVGMAGIGPSRSGRRSFIPGESTVLVEGGRLAGLMPDAGQLGIVAAAIAVTAALVVLSPVSRTHSARGGRATLALAWATLVTGAASVVLAEAKGMLLALGAAVAVALLAHNTSIGHRIAQQPWRRLAAIGTGSGLLVVVAPFVGAAVLDPAALRPEVWRRSIATLEGREWLLGLGSQPLRMDREFHTRVDSSWGAVQAHNQAMELLLIAGLPGLGLMLLITAVLVAVGLRTSRLAHGWTAGAATLLIVGGASGPNLTYFGHDLASVLVAGTLVVAVMRTRPDRTDPVRLVRLDDDPVLLPGALEALWAAGDAAVVTPPSGPGSALPAPVQNLLGRGPKYPSAALPAGTALVVPTSGSTGTPRAVVLSHAALAASTAASLAALDCAPGERWTLALPVRHVAGLQVLARARALGTTPYVVPDPGDPAALAAAAAHAEHIAIVPTQLVRCLDAGVDLTGFRSVLVGGGPLDPDRAEQARAAGVRLVQSYGMTETCGGCVYDGRPLSGVEVDVVEGRIRLQGPMLATGYLDPSPADAARFTADGWFITDDLGRLSTDADGATLLEVIGRGDDVINTGGVKVAPAAVEAALRTLASVRDVVVLASPDPEWGERIRAVIVPTDPSAPPTLEELRATVTGHLPSSHAPRELVLVDTIARDGLGKLTAGERERLRRM